VEIGIVCVGHTEPVEVLGKAIAHPSTAQGDDALFEIIQPMILIIRTFTKSKN
jgi:hypothetical protein